ncbi:unnamed protein product [Ilex paraguariensis]|uniref:DC-UbP/UBTD2 N-terminal domain-containing protein n=1 Tax=Ilex paraguariensis TaxID=185542 RepID=A0ABC8RWZ2_9AQUA
MGCTGSSPAKGNETAKKIRKPKPWKHSEPITMAHLMKMRDEFWDTAPHYGGQKAENLVHSLTMQPVHEHMSSVRFACQNLVENPLSLFFFWEIWDALRAAAEADLALAQAIVESAGVIVQAPDLTVCYDERGAKYELPKYVLSEPTNLIRNS